nr:MAG TPA: hypothetical protein [Caudoviricetes sp.]
MNSLSTGAKLALYGVLALAIMGALTGAYLHIKEIGREEVIGELLEQTIVVNKARAAIAAPIEKKVVQKVTEIAVVTETIVKEVPVYVKTSDCPMSPGFRVLHDAAADGRLPDPANIPDAAPAPAAEVASTVATNYGTCNKALTIVNGWQEWADEQAKLKTR